MNGCAQMEESEELRCRVQERIAFMLYVESPNYGRNQWDKFSEHYLNLAGSILSMPEITIVDRGRVLLP